MKTLLKGNRLNPDDEVIREIITDIRAPTRRRERDIKALQGIKTRQSMPDSDHKDRKERYGVDVAPL